jgi:hypothetical protein
MNIYGSSYYVMSYLLWQNNRSVEMIPQKGHVQSICTIVCVCIICVLVMYCQIFSFYNLLVELIIVAGLQKHVAG